ncbi:MAG: zinc-dependent metalloprotease [Algicola sp.]|nr:zinc-dependent metalloprotease [Algicola sp.]
MRKILFLLCYIGLSLPVNAQILKSKSLQNYQGFFNFYYEASTDKIYLEVSKLDADFLYVNSLATGIGSNEIGLDRGQLGNTRLVRFEKAGNKLLLVQPNLDFRALTDNDLEKKSIDQAFAKSVLFGFKIVETNASNYIIDLTPFLMQDAHGVIQRLKSEGTYKLDSSKSALSLERTKAFPKNVEFEALLTFKGEPKGRQIRTVTPTASLVSVIQHHSFIELPDDDFEKRPFDPRSGAISFNYMDYATPIFEPIKKRYIIRHRLEKKNPEAIRSEAVEPIVYYLDPGTPEPVRSALLEGAQWWNDAFEAIGFENAFQVKMLPENADPMDCRYNVIQWVHRSTRGWSYGASVVDPRTGEIIKGHVSLGSLRIRQDFMIAQALMNRPFAKSDAYYQPMLDMALARIRQLSAHEVGHTLGFAHNFASSTNNRASVMDYPHPKLRMSDGQIDFSDAYDTGVGLWDQVTVAYSYAEFDENRNEKAALDSILEGAQKKGLRFITDADARAQGGAHALAHLWDNGKSAADELQTILEIRAKAISNFSKDNIRVGDPYSVLEDVFVPLYFFHRYQTEATTKVVGGLDYNYAIKGDGQPIVASIDAKTQKKALEALINTIASETLAISKDKLALFPPRAFGYGRSRESFSSQVGVAFDPLNAANTASEFTLKLLLHPERANRILLQSRLDDSQLSLEDVFNKLIEATFKKTHSDPYMNDIQQMVNNNVLKYLMNLAVNDSSYFQVQALANSYIAIIEKELESKNLAAYDSQYLRIIKEFKEHSDKFKLKNAPKIPDGSPIGSDFCNYNSN